MRDREGGWWGGGGGGDGGVVGGGGAGKRIIELVSWLVVWLFS